MPCHMDATTSHPEVEFDHSLPENWKLSWDIKTVIKDATRTNGK